MENFIFFAVELLMKAYTKTMDQRKIAGTFADRHIEYKSEGSEKLSIEQNF